LTQRKQPAPTKMNMQSNAISWLFRISIEAAFICMPHCFRDGLDCVQPAHNRLKALWRVGFGLMKMRGTSGNLQPRGPKARAATGGSAGGAGPSGFSLKRT
jgi:hypothetical protein